MSFTTIIAATSITTTTTITANYSATLMLLPLPFLALLANPTCTTIALSCLLPLHIPIL